MGTNRSAGSIGGAVNGVTTDENEKATLALQMTGELFSEDAQKEKEGGVAKWHNRLMEDARMLSLYGEPLWLYEEEEELHHDIR